ncbi:MAG: L,D-transpeptidase family protein [Rhizobiales bacterium]|nr:L,D-transpeptidase family protein [Hyphomicrobiales bacterium]
MNRVAVRMTVAALALAVMAGIAAADTMVIKKKKLGFFASLFSSLGQTDGSRQRRTVFGGGNFLNGKEDGIRIITGSGNEGDLSAAGQYAPSSGLDPESSDEGYGMGNLTYVPDRLVSLGNNSFKQARPTGAVEGAIYDALTSIDAGITAREEIREAAVGQYQGTGFRPLWIDNGKLAPRAAALLKVLSDAAAEGMQPANYLPPQLSSFEAASDLSAADSATLARLDIGITAMALKYARDASGGAFDPRRLSRYNDVTPGRVEAAQAMRVLAYSPFPDSYLAGLQPQHPAYQAMKKALAELRREAGDRTFVAIARGKKVKLGQSDARIPEVRRRLAGLGATVPAGPDPLVLDDGLSAALKDLQKKAGQRVTGLLDNGTVNRLNDATDGRKLNQLVINMERLRWLPKELGRRYVFVNQAAFEVRVMEGAKQVWTSRVIVGKPSTQTAVFNDEIETVVFNPSWGVPPSIVANDYLPKLRDDPSYLDRIGFKVTTPSGELVASSDIDWNAYDRKVPFNIQQPPGPKNALGELKFLFPNAHNIYMHDTPDKQLFGEQVRAFSHGCVRVQNPREFATVLLGWGRAKVDANTDSKRSQTVRLPNKVPIYIAYFTAWPDETGRIKYYGDVYGRDDALGNAMTATTLALR